MFKSLSFKEFIVISENLQTIFQLDFYLVHRCQKRLSRRDVVALRENGQAWHPPHDLARQRVKIGKRLNLVVEQLDAHSIALGFSRKYVDNVATDPVIALRQIEFVPFVLHLGQPAKDRPLIDPVAANEVQYHAEIGFRITQPVNR